MKCPRLRLFFPLALAASLLCVGMGPARAALLADGQALRSIPFVLRDGHKPMIPAKVDDKTGFLMLDNGTPDALFLNRDAIPLKDGQFVARGTAASGQPIEVQTHGAPTVWIDGLPVALASTVRSGNFLFTVAGLGPDFLGFMGTKMLESDAFVLDYERRLVSIIRVNVDRQLAIAQPPTREVRLTTPFFIWPGEQPTVVGALGSSPLLIDFDTGDEGTLYLTAATKARLQRQQLLRPQGEGWVLAGLRIGGVRFEPVAVRVVDADGPQDFRHAGRADQLRLGASFLADHPCLWNFPAKTLTFLRPGSGFLRGLAAARPSRD
jgi:hypothetical protein